MYTKDLKEDLRLRLTTLDMDFLRKISAERGTSVSECIRSIIGEYRRSLETIDALKQALAMSEELKKQAFEASATKEEKKKGRKEKLSHGDTKSNKHDIV